MHALQLIHRILRYRQTACRTPLLGVVALVLGSSLLGGVGYAQMAHTPPTVTVEPTGGDDTQALQAALEQCSGAAAGCVVELAPGTFRTRPLLVHDFHGSPRGAGREATTIEAKPDIDVVDAEPAVIAVAPTVEDPWPFLVSFIDGDIHVSDLTLSITEPAPTTGWQFFDTNFDAMVATLLVTGTHADAVIERIGVQGAAGNFSGSNLINGLYIEGAMPNEEGPWSLDASPPLQGSFVVRDSTFSNAGYNLATTNLSDSLVLIEGNTFDDSPVVDGGASDIDLLDHANTVTIVRDNTLGGVRGMGIHVVQGAFASELTSSLYVVTGNQIRARSTGQGIVLSDNIWSGGGDATVQAFVSDNAISLAAEAHAVFTTGSHGVQLVGNRFGGSGRAGITIGTEYGADELARAENWTIAGNDMSTLDVREQWIVLGEGATNNTVVCDEGISAIDEGTGNTVMCE